MSAVCAAGYSADSFVDLLQSYAAGDSIPDRLTLPSLGDEFEDGKLRCTRWNPDHFPVN